MLNRAGPLIRTLQNGTGISFEPKNTINRQGYRCAKAIPKQSPDEPFVEVEMRARGAVNDLPVAVAAGYERCNGPADRRAY